MKEIKGNLFEQEVDAVCITTNGYVKKDGNAVMGAGVAKQATILWPNISTLLGNHLKTFGNHVAPLHYDMERKYAVVSFPVKDNWWEDAKLSLVEQSCRELVEVVEIQGWKNVVLPRPGCGSGKRLWTEIKPILDKYLDDRFTIVDWETDGEKTSS